MLISSNAHCADELDVSAPISTGAESSFKIRGYEGGLDFDDASSGYLRELYQSAIELELHKAPTWIALMHYQKGLLGSIKSDVDGQDFFLSQIGKHNSKAELGATLTAFFIKQPAPHSKHPAQCRFPARYDWLKKQLAFDQSRLPELPCIELNAYYDAMAPDSMTVVFPSTHPNSPSSMFGHTLLRVDKKEQTDDTRMLAFSITYAAVVDPSENMMSYTINGLSGGYPGKFMIVPYYMKLREYSQIENRDLWEYKLKLSQQQIQFVILHAFELAYTYFDYYFFTENCSYHLLSLLNVAFPDSPLTDEFPGWTIPVDTLKTLRERNLIEEGKFYPSIVRVINERKRKLNQENRDLVIQASQQTLDAILPELTLRDVDQQVDILDLLSEYNRYLKIKDSGSMQGAELSNSERDVLLYRSKINQKSAKLNISAPDISPEQGHGSGRVGIGFGTEDDRDYAELEWRPAYHDYLDPGPGFIANSSVEFMKLKLRHSSELNQTRLHEVLLLNVESLDPRNDFFQDYSWHAHMRWFDSTPMFGETEESLLDLNVGGGVSYAISQNEKSVLSIFANASLYHSDYFSENNTLAPSIQARLIVEPSINLRIAIEGISQRDLLEGHVDRDSLSLESAFRLSQNHGVRLKWERYWLEYSVVDDLSLRYHYYF